MRPLDPTLAPPAATQGVKTPLGATGCAPCADENKSQIGPRLSVHYNRVTYAVADRHDR